MLPPTADLLEIIYTLFAILGALGAGGATWYAWRDWQANHRAPHGTVVQIRRNAIVARQVLYNRLTSMVIQIGIIILGVRAMSLPTNQAIARDWTAYIGGGVLLLISLLASLNALSNFVSNYQFEHVQSPKLTTTPKESPHEPTDR